MAAPRHIMIRRVVWRYYLVPIVPILALGYAALMSWLPSWVLLVALFAFFMWLFSLLFTGFTVIMRKWRATPATTAAAEPRGRANQDSEPPQ